MNTTNKKCLLISASYPIMKFAFAHGDTARPTQVWRSLKKFLTRLIREYSFVDSVIFVFDGKSSNATRKAIDPTYKANRPPIHENIRLNISECMRRLKSLGIESISIDFVEADDTVASVVAQNQNIYFHLLDQDKDMFDLYKFTNYKQIVHKSDIGIVEIGDEYSIKRYGVLAKDIALMLSLAGDASDNIAGVKGIGVGTAAKIINLYKTYTAVINDSSLDNELSGRVLSSVLHLRSDAGIKEFNHSYSLVKMIEDLSIELKLDNSPKECIMKMYNGHSIMSRYINKE
jgi:DNA polymerase I